MLNAFDELADVRFSIVVQEEKYPGGSLVKVSKGALREKQDTGLLHTPNTPAAEAWIEKSCAPIRAVFDKERKAA